MNKSRKIKYDNIIPKTLSLDSKFIDFTDNQKLIKNNQVSEILNTYIHDVVDHAFLVFEDDEVALDALRMMETGHRTVILPFIPTAENLAKWAFEKVESHISSSYGNSLILRAFHVRETPKSWASWYKE